MWKSVYVSWAWVLWLYSNSLSLLFDLLTYTLSRWSASNRGDEMNQYYWTSRNYTYSVDESSSSFCSSRIYYLHLWPLSSLLFFSLVPSPHIPVFQPFPYIVFLNTHTENLFSLCLSLVITLFSSCYIQVLVQKTPLIFWAFQRLENWGSKRWSNWLYQEGFTLEETFGWWQSLFSWSHSEQWKFP